MKHDFLNIDLEHLEDEWVKQPGLVAKFGELAADARQEFDEAKRRLDVVKADVGKKIREDPDEYGLSKSTVDAVNAAIILQPEVEEAEQDVINARHEFNVYEAMMTALDNRKKALEGVVYLHGQSYFSIPHDSTGVMEETERADLRRRRHRTEESDD